MITIGQLAAYAGVSIKAVRHYHERGLLAEPERDASGYRRYSADDAIRLVKIKTLADAGVPLGRVKELLEAGPEQLAAAVAEIDRDLRRRAEDIRRARSRIAALQAGDRLFVSDEVAEYLDRLRAIGCRERTVRLERDVWILLHSRAPQEAAAVIADKRAALEDPEFVAIYREYDAAFDWAPDDPRLPVLAERARRWLAGRPPVTPESRRDPALARLVATAPGTSSPAWNRLADLAAATARR